MTAAVQVYPRRKSLAKTTGSSDYLRGAKNTIVKPSSREPLSIDRATIFLAVRGAVAEARRRVPGAIADGAQGCLSQARHQQVVAPLQDGGRARLRGPGCAVEAAQALASRGIHRGRPSVSANAAPRGSSLERERPEGI